MGYFNLKTFLIFLYQVQAMDDPAPLFHTKFSGDEVARAKASQIDSLLSVACALTRAGRSVDVHGLETFVGQLCASCLDLPPNIGTSLKPTLASILLKLNEFQEELRLVSTSDLRQKATKCTSKSKRLS